MFPEEYKIMYELEGSYWWYKGMRFITASVIQRVITQRGRGLCLDVGCGTGANLQNLSKWNDCVGFDVSKEVMPFIARRGIDNVVRASVEHIPFADKSFDLVTAFEVIQRVDDDLWALRETFKVLKPGGHILIREAAFDFLSGEHDIATGMKRRYTRKMVIDKMQKAGFKVVWSSYANFFLFFPILLLRSLRRIFSSPHGRSSPKSDFRFTPKGLNPILTCFLLMESLWLRKFQVPFGVSVIVIGKREDES